MNVSFDEIKKVTDKEKALFHMAMKKCLEMKKSKETKDETRDETQDVVIEIVRTKIVKKVFHVRANMIFSR